MSRLADSPPVGASESAATEQRRADANRVYGLADAVRDLAPSEIDDALTELIGSGAAGGSPAVARAVEQARRARDALLGLSGGGPVPRTARRAPTFGRHDPIEVARIQRGLLLGLGWIAEQRAQFAVPELANGAFGKDDVARLKPLSELALSVWLTRRLGVAMPFLDETADWIWAQIQEGRALVRLLMARHDFLPACAIAALLGDLGYRNPILSRTLAYLAELSISRALPLQPWAQLALDYHLVQLGLRRDPPDQRSLFLSARPEPWVISGELGYAITHETFYLADFGLREMPDPDTLDYVRTWLPYWARSFEADADWDLVGELSMAARCVGLAVPPAFGALLDAQDEDGSIPGPDGAGSFLFGPDDSAERRRFLGRYHTTLVAVMASAMALARPSSAPMTGRP